MINAGRTIVEVAREIGEGEQLSGRWVAAERARRTHRLRRGAFSQDPQLVEVGLDLVLGLVGVCGADHRRRSWRA